MSQNGVLLPHVQVGAKFHPDTSFEPPCVVSKAIRYDTAVSIGAFSMLHGPGECVGVSVGRYCSIAPSAVLGANEHAMDWLSTSSLLENPHLYGWSQLQNLASDEARSAVGNPYQGSIKEITIGNDVWIGQSVFVRGGTTIGDGAVIAAGSIVTRDVEPYSIVAGNPARHVRYRFEPPTISALLDVRWWQYSIFDLLRFDMTNVEAAIEAIGAASVSGTLSPYMPEKFDAAWLNDEDSV
jgi:acetyltransferase-like isoleucine patch superfamily enzyme